MTATIRGNKSPNMKKWMARAYLPKVASTFERMNGRPQPLFSNKMTHYVIELTTPSSLLKKIYYPYKIFDASDRSF